MAVRAGCCCSTYFNPRPPRGGRRACLNCASTGQGISIHALREEGDGVLGNVVAFVADFNPRPPRGGRRSWIQKPAQQMRISIHALREEGDSCRPKRRRPKHNFNPRPPRGGRPADGISITDGVDFNPRPPRGGRREIYAQGTAKDEISIHALREEGDKIQLQGKSQQHYFNPRPPRGGRPDRAIRATDKTDFNPRPPRGGRPLEA